MVRRKGVETPHCYETLHVKTGKLISAVKSLPNLNARVSTKEPHVHEASIKLDALLYK